MSEVDLVGIHFSYGDVNVLKGIDLHVSDGEIVCILGPSGSGKSTMLRLVNALLLPQKGHVAVDGELVGRVVRGGRLHAASEKQLIAQRKRIGMVFQQFELFGHLTVTENLILAPTLHKDMTKPEAIERAQELLQQVGLSGFGDRYPGQLSGGQQQRVAIARALMMNPGVLLFDEPTSALDHELVGEVLSVMRNLAEQGITMLIVTHETGFARNVADRVVFMEGGVVVEEGPPSQVIDNPRTERLKKYFAER